MGILIKSVATVSDISTVADLAKTIWNEHYVPIIGQAQVDYMLEKYHTPKAIRSQINTEGFEYFLIISSGIPVGYIAYIEKNNELFLSKLYILGSERGKGFGRIAIEFLSTKCKADGFDFITLTVNKKNLNTILAYEKMGFEKYDEVVNDIGSGFVMDDYIMRLPINSN
jgi:ribosomal protein S18 acetylase RimI-like enzyme